MTLSYKLLLSLLRQPADTFNIQLFISHTIYCLRSQTTVNLICSAETERIDGNNQGMHKRFLQSTSTKRRWQLGAEKTGVTVFVCTKQMHCPFSMWQQLNYSQSVLWITMLHRGNAGQIMRNREWLFNNCMYIQFHFVCVCVCVYCSSKAYPSSTAKSHLGLMVPTLMPWWLKSSWKMWERPPVCKPERLLTGLELPHSHTPHSYGRVVDARLIFRVTCLPRLPATDPHAAAMG